MILTGIMASVDIHQELEWRLRYLKLKIKKKRSIKDIGCTFGKPVKFLLDRLAEWIRIIHRDVKLWNFVKFRQW